MLRTRTHGRWPVGVASLRASRLRAAAQLCESAVSRRVAVIRNSLRLVVNESTSRLLACSPQRPAVGVGASLSACCASEVVTKYHVSIIYVVIYISMPIAESFPLPLNCGDGSGV